MVFHSLEFLVFLICVLCVYWTLGWRRQNLFLIPASLFFYGFAHPWFVLPFLLTTFIDYFVAIAIETRRNRAQIYVAVSVASNLGLLGAFKYFNFFSSNLSAVLSGVHVSLPLPVLHVVLPAGISFYTFQSIGYVVDVYRQRLPACRRLTDYGLFVAFFPQLVAGPIQRAGSLIGQIQNPRTVSPSVVFNAVSLLAWGYFKKVVIADNVAIIANEVFALRDPSFPILWAGVFAFCIQIYADFSGYTDIARAVARLMGFELSENFNCPYFAQSPSDFWRRWHISLSTWIRDYIYIPLGGSRGTEAKTIFNLLIVFLLTGLWHGASWNFVLWGLYYWLLTFAYRIASACVPERIQKLPAAPAARILLMFALTNAGWLIFREQELNQLIKDFTLSPFQASGVDWHIASYLVATVVCYTIPLLISDAWRAGVRRLIDDVPFHPILLRWGTAVRTSLILAGILALRSSTVADFIYFQF